MKRQNGIKHLRSFIADRDLDELVIAKDLAIALPILTLEETLLSAIEKFAAVSDAELPVVDNKNPKELLDTVSRWDLIEIYYERITTQPLTA